MNKLTRIAHFIKTITVYKMIFREIGFRSIIISPLKIEHAENIKIQDRVLIGYKSWLSATPIAEYNECILNIGSGCNIGNFSHIYATKQIVIEENVLIADKVYISDNLHGYKDVRLPVLMQPVIQNNIVIIGAGSWIGENVSILGAEIGKNCVIGANSVVTKNIPDFSVAVGSPARIIKRYCHVRLEWFSTEPDGNFKDKL